MRAMMPRRRKSPCRAARSRAGAGLYYRVNMHIVRIQRGILRGSAMQVNNDRRLTLALAALGAAAALVFIAWEYLHGGVKSHHLLNHADLPAISNWWGLLMLPLLGATAGWSIARQRPRTSSAVSRALIAAVGALVVGVALSVAFTTGHEYAASIIFLGLVLTGLVLPVYRAEYLFGFVLGMAFTFGAVLPTLVGLVAALLSAATHLLTYPLILKAYRRVRA